MVRRCPQVWLQQKGGLFQTALSAFEQAIDCCLYRRWPATSSRDMCNSADHEDDQEDHEQNLCDACRRGGNTAKSEDGGNDRQDEKKIANPSMVASFRGS
jgi:hypothetical protein